MLTYRILKQIASQNFTTLICRLFSEIHNALGTVDSCVIADFGHTNTLTLTHENKVKLTALSV